MDLCDVVVFVDLLEVLVVVGGVVVEIGVD